MALYKANIIKTTMQKSCTVFISSEQNKGIRESTVAEFVTRTHYNQLFVFDPHSYVDMSQYKNKDVTIARALQYSATSKEYLNQVADHVFDAPDLKSVVIFIDCGDDLYTMKTLAIRALAIHPAVDMVFSVPVCNHVRSLFPSADIRHITTTE